MIVTTMRDGNYIATAGRHCMIMLQAAELMIRDTRELAAIIFISFIFDFRTIPSPLPP